LEGYLFPAHPSCESVPFNSNPPNAPLAIATDLLAQAEAQHRTASRLEQSVRQRARAPHDRAGIAPTVEQIREQMRALRDLFDAERVLLDELERELSTANR
jgi:hypothetical protein